MVLWVLVSHARTPTSLSTTSAQEKFRNQYVLHPVLKERSSSVNARSKSIPRLEEMAIVPACCSRQASMCSHALSMPTGCWISMITLQLEKRGPSTILPALSTHALTRYIHLHRAELLSIWASMKDANVTTDKNMSPRCNVSCGAAREGSENLLKNDRKARFKYGHAILALCILSA